MSRAFFVVDVQNDFTENGALGVTGGDEVARRVSGYLADHADAYRAVIASRDWHDADNDNGGHFSSEPDFVDSWPVHCVAGTAGAEYDVLLDISAVTHHVKKGQGEPSYSLFEGVADDGRSVVEILDELGVDEVDVAGIATDHCVRASALDALGSGRRVRILTDLVAGVAPESSAAAIAELTAAGATLGASGESGIPA